MKEWGKEMEKMEGGGDPHPFFIRKYTSGYLALVSPSHNHYLSLFNPPPLLLSTRDIYCVSKSFYVIYLYFLIQAPVITIKKRRLFWFAHHILFDNDYWQCADPSITQSSRSTQIAVESDQRQTWVLFSDITEFISEISEKKKIHEWKRLVPFTSSNGN